jgi:hypothetical protein
MRFLLLLPELPRARYGALLDRGINHGRTSAVRRGRTLVLSAADVLGRRLGVGHRRIDPVDPRLS